MRRFPALVKRLSFWFALIGYIGYFLTVLYYFGPLGVAYSVALDHILPFWMCIMTDHGMPVPAVALFIAPINATIYGVGGATVGWVLSSLFAKLRSRNEPKTTPSSC